MPLMIDLTSAVDYVLANRYRIGNRVAIAFLALVRERPSPKRRVQWERLGMLFGASHRSYVSALLREMKRLLTSNPAMPRHDMEISCHL